MAEAALELAVGMAQGGFWIHIEVAGQVGADEQQVADLVQHPLRLAAAVQLGADFVQLLLHFLQHIAGVRPVEADAGGAPLELQGAEQGGQAGGHAVQSAGRLAGGLGLGLPLGLLVILPGSGLGLGGLDHGISEDMGMAADHLFGDPVGHLAQIELAGLLGHAGMENHLEQEIAKLVPERRHVLALDGVGHLIGFLDRIGGDGGEVLLQVPRAAALGIAELGHDRHQPVDRGFQAFVVHDGRLRIDSESRGRRDVSEGADGIESRPTPIGLSHNVYYGKLIIHYPYQSDMRNQSPYI